MNFLPLSGTGTGVCTRTGATAEPGAGVPGTGGSGTCGSGATVSAAAAVSGTGASADPGATWVGRVGGEDWSK